MRKDKGEKEGFWILPSGQVFFDYGPVSMVVSAYRGGKLDTKLCSSAFSVIKGGLEEIHRYHELLRCYLSELDLENLSGIPLEMTQAVVNTRSQNLTPMAAVAGAMSDRVADFLQKNGAEKVVVNNGGDIAVRLSKGERLSLGVVYDVSCAGVNQVLNLEAEEGIGGIATSGLGGRSLTTGIASGVTAFSKYCRDADALATFLADCSYISSPRVHTELAGNVEPGSDIADQRVVTHLDVLGEEEIKRALAQVLEEGEKQYHKGKLLACIATVQGNTVHYDPGGLLKMEK